MQRIIAPSMLSADFGHLADATQMIDRSDAQWVHIDVMDGVFVPNISFGFPVMDAIARNTEKPLDVHLMITGPERYVERFAKSGARSITFHYEAMDGNPPDRVCRVRDCIKAIHAAGALAGVSIKPATPVGVLEELLGEIDLALIMSVEPGFGGQSFMDESLEKVAKLRESISATNSKCLIEVDGGISAANAESLFEAGADALVAGNAIFGAADPLAEIRKMLNGGR